MPRWLRIMKPTMGRVKSSFARTLMRTMILLLLQEAQSLAVGVDHSDADDFSAPITVAMIDVGDGLDDFHGADNFGFNQRGTRSGGFGVRGTGYPYRPSRRGTCRQCDLFRRCR